MKKIENFIFSPDLGRLQLRVGLAVLMLFHGYAKVVNGIDPIIGMVSGVGLPDFVAYGVYVGEVLAPLMLLFGFRVRIAALIIICNMLVAIGLAHLGDVFRLTQTGGWAIELQVFYILVGKAIFTLGGGKYAVSTKSRWD